MVREDQRIYIHLVEVKITVRSSRDQKPKQTTC